MHHKFAIEQQMLEASADELRSRQTEIEELTRALTLLVAKCTECEQRRDELLDALACDRTLTPLLREAMNERAEAVVQEFAALRAQQETLRAGL